MYSISTRPLAGRCWSQLFGRSVHNSGPEHLEQRPFTDANYSIISSAREINARGMVTPIVFAVFRLKTNSNSVGCSIGRSVGFAPLKNLVHVGCSPSMYGDKGYASDERKRAAEKAGVKWAVKEKAQPGRKLTVQQRARNHRFGKVRAKVEHLFRVMKCQFGYRKVRYRGIVKNGAQVFSLLAR